MARKGRLDSVQGSQQGTRCVEDCWIAPLNLILTCALYRQTKSNKSKNLLQLSKARAFAFVLRNNLSIATCIRNLLSTIGPNNRNGPPTPSRGSRTTNLSFASSKMTL